MRRTAVNLETSVTNDRLRAWLRRLDLPTSGTKAELRRRIAAANMPLNRPSTASDRSLWAHCKHITSQENA